MRPPARLDLRLEGCKGQFGPAAALRTETLLKQARMSLKKGRRWPADRLIQLHETLLFLRAYPQSRGVLRLCDEILFGYSNLFGYSKQLRGLAPLELAEFEYADVSGIAGTGLTTDFSYVFARSLAARHAARLRIDWDRYPGADRLGPVLARLIPEAR